MSELPQIMVAPTGARRGPADHPALPITIPQIVANARACFAAGAQAIHAHVRDADGRHVLDAALYRELLAELARAVPQMVVQITTEAVGRYPPQAQRALVRSLLPDQVSIALREISDGQSDDEVAAFFRWTADSGIGVQHILYTPQEVATFERYVASGVIPGDRLELMFVLGQYDGARDSQPQDIDAFLAQRRGAIADAGWSVCAFGRNETACLVRAIREGGKARVGFENNLYNSDGSVAPSNAARVAELRRALSAEGVPGPGDVENHNRSGVPS